jgi:hypothetical protein
LKVEAKAKTKKAKKRGAGEGSIYRRGDGLWCASATVGQTATGKQRRRVVYAATRGEVAEKLRELSNDVAQCTVAEPGRLRVSNLVERYLEHKRGTVRPRVHESYEQRLRVHVLPLLGKLPLRRLAAVHVLDLAAALRRERQQRAATLATGADLFAVKKPK